jgi:hypothetical protein
MYAVFRAFENCGADLLDNLSINMTNGAPVLTVPPVAQTNGTFRRATFVTKVDGTPPFTFQWFTNNVRVTGATNFTFTTGLLGALDDGTQVKVAVTNASGGLESPAVTLTVTNDATAPVLVSAGSLNGTSVGVAFNETLDPTSATTPGNYSVSPGGLVTSVTLLPDGQRVRVNLASSTSGGFTVTVNGVKDLAGNTIVAASMVGGTVLGLTPSDIGSPITAGSSYSASGGDVDSIGGGADFFGQGDQGHVTVGPRTGDFDIKVRVANLQRNVFLNVFATRDEGAQAGLIAREDLTAGSRFARIAVFPPDTGLPMGLNVVAMSQRTVPIAGAASVGTSAIQGTNGGYFPNAWLRLRRVNQSYTGYWSSNGTTWIQHSLTTFPDGGLLAGGSPYLRPVG